jgi:hypothetical protein
VAPQFVKFVRSVEGRLVGRWDAGPYHYFGARLGSNEERAEDKPIIWDTQQVIPLTQEFVIRFGRELGRALRHGDLKVASEAEYTAWLAVDERREAAADAKRKATAPAEAAAEPVVAAAPPEAAASAPPDQPPDPPTAPDAEPKPEKRK